MLDVDLVLYGRQLHCLIHRARSVPLNYTEPALGVSVCVLLGCVCDNVWLLTLLNSSSGDKVMLETGQSMSTSRLVQGNKHHTKGL